MAEVTIRDYLNKVRMAKQQLPDVVNDSLFQNESKIVDLNKAQLYDGKDVLGNDIRPFYSEDTFFKTQLQAQGYIKWKQKITPNSSRNPNAPNLYINGHHYSMIGLLKNGIDVFIGLKSKDSITYSIDTKFKNIYGLTPQNQDKVNKEIIIPTINEFLTKIL